MSLLTPINLDNVSQGTIDYVSVWYYAINSCLRKRRIAKVVQPLIDDIIADINNLGISSGPIRLYRGLDDEMFYNLPVGYAIRDEGFNSQSTSYTSSSFYSSVAMLVITWQTIDKLLYFEEEEEVLTYPGVEYTITRVEKKGEKFIYYVEARSIFEEIKEKIAGWYDSSLDHYQYEIEEIKPIMFRVLKDE